MEEKQGTLKVQIYAYGLSASSSGRVIYIWTKYCVVLVKWGKFLSLRNYGVQPTGSEIHYAAVTVLFCSVELRASAAEGLPLSKIRTFLF